MAELRGADAFHAVNRRVEELLPSPATWFAGNHATDAASLVLAPTR